MVETGCLFSHFMQLTKRGLPLIRWALPAEVDAASEIESG
jgi:hypothetical protein